MKYGQLIKDCLELSKIKKKAKFVKVMNEPLGVETKRIRQFKEQLVKDLPKFPNDKLTRDTLLNMSLNEVLLHYCNWRLRFIRPAVRKVVIANDVINDSRYIKVKQGIDLLLKKIASGDDITPYLSLSAVEKGFTLALSAPPLEHSPKEIDRWADKDFLLNVMGFHHFHLGTETEDKGHIVRTNEVLFAKVTRDIFEALLILDHSVFDDENSTMSAERLRLWEIFDKYSSRGIPSGVAFIPSIITTSGHPIYIKMYVDKLASLIRDVDKNLDSHEYLVKLYGSANVVLPKKPRPSFMMYGLDFGLYEKTANTFMLIHKGCI